MKRILIIDENRFSRICSAIFEDEGFETEIFDNIENESMEFKDREFGLVITSYPFSHNSFGKIKKMNLPTIILTDQINRAFINLLEGFNNSYCMVKPLDFHEFRSLVKQIASCEIQKKNEINIL